VIALPFVCSQNWVPQVESFRAILQMALVPLLLCSDIELLQHTLIESVANHDSLSQRGWLFLGKQNVVNQNGGIIPVYNLKRNVLSHQAAFTGSE
jgi:hypothetical protein